MVVDFQSTVGNEYTIYYIVCHPKPRVVVEIKLHFSLEKLMTKHGFEGGTPCLETPKWVTNGTANVCPLFQECSV